MSIEKHKPNWLFRSTATLAALGATAFGVAQVADHDPAKVSSNDAPSQPNRPNTSAEHRTNPESVEVQANAAMGRFTNQIYELLVNPPKIENSHGMFPNSKDGTVHIYIGAHATYKGQMSEIAAEAVVGRNPNGTLNRADYKEVTVIADLPYADALTGLQHYEFHYLKQSDGNITIRVITGAERGKLNSPQECTTTPGTAQSITPDAFHSTQNSTAEILDSFVLMGSKPA